MSWYISVFIYAIRTTHIPIDIVNEHKQSALYSLSFMHCISMASMTYPCKLEYTRSYSCSAWTERMTFVLCIYSQSFTFHMNWSKEIPYLHKRVIIRWQWGNSLNSHFVHGFMVQKSVLLATEAAIILSFLLWCISKLNSFLNELRCHLSERLQGQTNCKKNTHK